MKLRLLSVLFSLLSVNVACFANVRELTVPVSEDAAASGVWIALDAMPGFGSSVIETGEGGRVFLPFQADVALELREGAAVTLRVYRDFRWSEVDVEAVAVSAEADGVKLNLASVAGVDRLRSVQWFSATEGHAQSYLPTYYSVVDGGELELRGRYGAPGNRPRIYQMLPRLFGNENETRAVNGTLAENGSGKFSDLSERVLENLRRDGFTHLWLTGVIQQATSTDYSEIGQPADDPDLLKGIAGSPYAIKDYFDVSPDYADDPALRLEEFRALAQRMKDAGLRVVIDFVPNHVARSYQSDIRPDLSFGESDRTREFFHPDNNFYYLTPEVVEGSAPLRLPTVDTKSGEVLSESARLAGGADGRFAPEQKFGRVTGNNVVSWDPSEGDWYETVKLNYGFNFLNRDSEPEYPSAVTPNKPIPDTWRKMDAIIAYWQSMGVDGFRADMAHMVPPEFWKWMIHRAKDRDPGVLFFAEAYNDDPAKVLSREPSIQEESNVMISLLDAGFQAVYDDPGYDTLEHLYTSGAWANDLQNVEEGLGPYFFDNAVRYAENHDEIRLAHPETWGGNGLEVGRPVTGTLWGLSRGPVMLYHGQEVGEPGLGREGFGGDDERSTIFDYWSLPELNRWWNDGAADGGGLSPEQSELREWYVRLLHLQGEPAFTSGETVFLNHANRRNPFYGKIEDVGPAGHWFFSYLRSDVQAGSHFLVTTNFHPKAELRHIRIRLTDTAVDALRLKENLDAVLVLRERLSGEEGRAVAIPVDDAMREGIYLDSIEPLQAYYWEILIEEEVPDGVGLVPLLPPGNAFLGAPPLMRIEAGNALEIDLRRYGNPGKRGHFVVDPTEGVEVEVDHLNRVLTLFPKAGVRGLRVLPMRIEFDDGREPLRSALPLAIDSRPVHRFGTDDFGDAGSVAVVGEFNSWNTTSDPLQRSDDGWSLSRNLPAGRYLYKFVVDGNWLPDPSNELSEPDGYGGFNSVAVVEDLTAGLEPISSWVTKADAGEVRIQVNVPFRRVVAHGMSEVAGAVDLPVEMSGQWIRVDTSDVAEGTLVRVLVEDEQGRVGLPAIAYAGAPSSDSWRDDIIYYAFTDRFHDGDETNSSPLEDPNVAFEANYQGGDFAGILEKLNEGYFDALGVNVLWLAPLNQNPEDAWQEYLPPYRYYTGYHGYWPTERYGVEDRFGGEDALHSVVETAHDRGMKVLADLVLKHVHETHPIREERPDLFGELVLSDGTRNLRRWDDNPFTTWFEPFLPAFDFRNPEAINYLLEDAVYWMDTYQLDGYRLDAVKHIRPDFWWRFRTRMRDTFPGENHYFVGETFQSREGINAFVGPNMLDGQFDFPLYDVLIPCFAEGTVGMDRLEEALRQSEEVYGRTVRMSALVGNHDKSRFMAYADGDLPSPGSVDEEEVGWAEDMVVDDSRSYEKLKMALTFLLTIDGVPMIYYGDEIGMTGAGDPDNRRMMRFGSEVDSEELSVKEHFSRLAQTRRDHPALFMGSRRVLEASPDRYAYLRGYESDRALVVFNRSSEPQTFSLNLRPEVEEGELVDVLSGTSLQVRRGEVTLRLPPLSSALFVE